MSVATSLAVGRYQDAFRAFAANGASRDPGWLRALRANAMGRFGELGFPSSKQEEWRFTSVAPLVETPFTLAPVVGGPRLPAPATAALEPLLLRDVAPHCLVFVNGQFSEEHSRLGTTPSGVRVESLRRALARDPDFVGAHLGRYAGYDDQPFRALNTAFVSDGACIHVPAQCVLDEPIHIVYVTAAGASRAGPPLVTHPRTLIVVDREARAAVVETYASLGVEADVYWTNAVTEVVAGDGARVDGHRIQREGPSAFHVATTHSQQGKDSVVNVHAVAFGAALARHDLRLVLAGTGALGLLNGLSLLRDRQHVDHHTLIDHAQPHGESHEYFNGVLEAASRSVFTGRIIVRPGAQRTDSKQTNNNLLLSTDARADSQPQLEIYADDVKCTHGSTTGPLDERQLFYVRSRGLGSDEARRLLAYGFAAEILGRMAIEPLRARLDEMVRARICT